jgi:RecB family exonuclease
MSALLTAYEKEQRREGLQRRARELRGLGKISKEEAAKRIKEAEERFKLSTLEQAAMNKHRREEGVE